MFAKKNLVAAAALMALAGVAQADVKLYGMIDMSAGSFAGAHATGAAARTTQVAGGSMQTSFLGFGGSEDLGGGLKAEFALETFLTGDTGATVANNAGNFWGRASNVALSGGFGKVALGQYDNPLFTSGYTYNPFGSSMTFSPTMRHFNYIGQTTTNLTGAGVGFDTGWVNSVTYESPVMSGFQGIAQVAAKEKTGTNEKNSSSVAVSYNAGPLSAMLTYVKGGLSTSTTAYTANEKVWNLGASYDFIVVKAFGQYTDINESTPNAGKDKIYQLGVSVPVTDKAAVLASFGQLKNKTNAGVSTKNEVLSLGYDYTLSKRTDVYGVFMNERQSTLTSGQSFAVGIKHNF